MEELPKFRGHDGWLYRFTAQPNVFKRLEPPAPPSSEAILERARSLAHQAIQTVELQCSRLREDEGAGEDPFRGFYDWEMLIGALSRFRMSLRLAGRVEGAKQETELILSRFDERVPGLRKMRNVLEHPEDYGVDAQHFGKNRQGDVSVHRQQLQVASWAPHQYTWLGETLKVDDARQALLDSYLALRELQRRLRDSGNVP